jgi:hypothetical protein
MQKLRVWWVPQVPMEAFYVDVSSVEEGVKIMGVLGTYDKFQFDHNIKPDYCNVGGLQQYVDGEWEDWCIETEDNFFENPREWLASKALLLDEI